MVPTIKTKKRKSKLISIQLSPQAAVEKITYQQAVDTAIHLMNNNHLIEFRNVATQIVEQQEQEPGPKILLLKAHCLLDDLTAAHPLVEILLEQLPNHTTALMAVASFYRMSQEIEKAIDVLNRALSIEPNNAACLHELGACYSSYGEPEKAIELFRKGLKHDPANAEIYWQLASIKNAFNQDDAKQVEALIDSNQHQAHQLPLLHFALAKFYNGKDLQQEKKHLIIANSLVHQRQPWTNQSFLMQQQYYENMINQEVLSVANGIGNA